MLLIIGVLNDVEIPRSSTKKKSRGLSKDKRMSFKVHVKKLYSKASFRLRSLWPKSPFFHIRLVWR